jgi:hypothetical protein
MISRVHKQLLFDGADINEWSWEVLEAVGAFHHFNLYKDLKIPVEDGLATLPCGIYRVLRLRDGSGNRIDDYTDYGDQVEVNNASCILLDYLGIPVDINGRMQIPVDCKKACYWYCLVQLYTADYFNNKIPENRWQDMNRKKDGWIAWARGSFRLRSMDDVDRTTESQYLFTRTPRMNRQLGYHGKGF